MATYQTIEVKCREGYQVKDAISSEAMQPGHIVERVAAGTVKKNTILTLGLVSRQIALHDKYAGGTVTTAWASGARVQYGIFLPGDEVQLMLKDTADASVEEVLRVDATGCVIASGTDAAFARAMEAKVASGDELIWARLL